MPATRRDEPPKARTAKEVALEQAQADIARGQLADARRKVLMMEFALNGMSQAELAARLTRGSLRGGGEAITENAVQKLIKRYRAAQERETREAIEMLNAVDPAATGA